MSAENVLLGAFTGHQRLTADALLVLAAQGGLHVHGSPDEPWVEERALCTWLRRFRKRGWVMFDRHTDPVSWARTPTGTTALAARR